MSVGADSAAGAFALLIGVQDYKAYDPSGAADLPAGVNDIGAFCRMCRRLGLPMENIHVLTSPKGLGEAGRNVDLHGEGAGYLGEATRDEILEQLGWLAGKLGHAPGDPSPKVGLLTYSGHGDYLKDELALCPSDVALGPGTDLEGLIAFSEIAKLLAVGGANENLTVVLDCCHAAAAVTDVTAPPAAKPRASLTGRPSPVKEAPLLGARMFLATAPSQTGYQSTFDATPHGALSWAMSVVLEQWTTKQEGDVKYATITHERLRRLSQGLLDALLFPQTIVLSPEGVGDVPFFHRGGRDAGDVTSEDPNRLRHGIQIDPDWAPPGWHDTHTNLPDWTIYEIWNESNPERKVKLGAIVVTRTAKDGFAASAEYWNIPAGTDLSTATNIKADAHVWGDAMPFPVFTNAPVYSMSTGAQWAGTSGNQQPSATVWTPATATPIFGLSISSASPPVWTWVQGFPRGSSVGAYVINGGVPALVRTAPSDPPQPLSWSHVSMTGVAPTFGSGMPAPSVPLTGSIASPVSFATVGTTLYMAFDSVPPTTSPAPLKLFQSSNGLQWSAVTGTYPRSFGNPQVYALTPTPGGSPALCYCGFQGSGNVENGLGKPWTLSSSSLGTGNPGGTVVSGLESETPPSFAATAAGGTAYVVYLDGTSVKHCTSTDNQSWSAPNDVAMPADVPGTNPLIGVSLTSCGGEPYLAVYSSSTVWVGKLTAFRASAKKALDGGNYSNGLWLGANESGTVLTVVTSSGGVAASAESGPWVTVPTNLNVASGPLGIGSFTKGLMLVPYVSSVGDPPNLTSQMSFFYGIC